MSTRPRSTTPAAFSLPLPAVTFGPTLPFGALPKAPAKLTSPPVAPASVVSITSSSPRVRPLLKAM
jgi:hypothetical protein